MDFPVAQTVKDLPAVRETWVRSLVGKIPWRREWPPIPVFLAGEFHGQIHGQSGGFPGGPDSKESACNEGDLGSIPGLGRFPGEGNGYPLQYSCLENPMDRRAWWPTVHSVAKSQT